MMAVNFDLTGKVAIVTGGNGGIGYGMARGLAQAGASIVIAARRPEKNAQAVAALQATGAKAMSVVTDVQDEPRFRRRCTPPWRRSAASIF